MKNIILATTLMALSTSSIAVNLAPDYKERIASTCKDAKEVVYASYLNSQQGTPLSTTLVRLSSIYTDDETSYEFFEQYARLAYTLDAPPIDKSLKDTALIVSKAGEDMCVERLHGAVEELINEDKVGM